MSNYNCRCDCTGLAVAASIAIGVITAILRFTGIITVTPAFLWVAFGIAVVYLALAALISAFSNDTNRRCACVILPVLLVGVLGTILASVILLAIEFAATSAVGAIITGALLLFFSLLITETVCLVKCQAGCNS